MSVCVVGSVNLDHVVRAPRIPGPGETILGTGVAEHPGGKGANQAIGAGRSGAETVFVGAMGDDPAASRLLAELRGAGVDAQVRTAAAGVPTGTAWITVGDDGENVIIVVPGANATVTELSAQERGLVASARILLLQQEIPESAMLDAASAVAPEALVLLNAAPTREVSPQLLALVDVLIVNEHEAADLHGAPATPPVLIEALLERVPAVVLTLGAAGSLVAVRGAEPVAVPAHPVKAVDATGAGDAFCGALAAEIDRAEPSSDLLDRLVAGARFATSVSALAVQRPGAASSIPWREEVLKAYPA
ncbi:ribokinase [Kineosporia sp. NBRC 101677]|uniref:ribokinase n=1 Tax=Kineosporia sp. NBRC 101677 TaxID=3032197 RepID=UPI0024A12330|nr:ribokinase [Kineosporia sp. NBRC 101677]GLY14545.1 ribokinase [Kineosporia sp. NBRC 101677]